VKVEVPHPAGAVGKALPAVPLIAINTAYMGIAVVEKTAVGAPEPGYHAQHETWQWLGPDIQVEPVAPMPEPLGPGDAPDVLALLAVVLVLVSSRRSLILFRDAAGKIVDSLRPPG
jgi:hypothetical protein